ncbi:hypothetical protein [Kitasatospora kazusensis]
MNQEAVILESRTMRGTLVERTEALDKVKALELLPDGLHVTTRMVADYFEVHEEAVNSVVRRHRDELRDSGLAVLKGADLQHFLVVNVTTRKPPGRGLAVFPRRAVLNVAMLLRDSEVARAVRQRLLDLAERSGARPVENTGQWSEALVTEIVERAVRVLRAEPAELREANAGLVRQLELERQLVAALSVRVADTSCEVRTLGGRVDQLCTLLSEPGAGRRRRPGRLP